MVESMWVEIKIKVPKEMYDGFLKELEKSEINELILRLLAIARDMYLLGKLSSEKR